MLKKIGAVALILLTVAVTGIATRVFWTPSPTVSVVMSTYNRADSLPLAVASILRQTFQDFEFIIINDGSSDDTAKVLKDLSSLDGRIRVLTNEKNKGLVYSLNRGLAAARGKYIARMDDDDLSLPLRFEKQVKFLETYPAITVLGTETALNTMSESSEKTADADEKETGSLPLRLSLSELPNPDLPDELRLKSYLQVPVVHPTVMMRADFIKKHGLRYDDAYRSAEDTHFWYQVTQNGGLFYVLPEKLLVYNEKSTKFDGYKPQQAKSYQAFLKTSVGAYLPADFLYYPPNVFQKCYIWRQLAKQGDFSQFRFDKKFLFDAIRQGCASHPTAYPVRHRAWTDFLIEKEPARVCRQDDCATVLARTEEWMRIKWDNWGEEAFELQPDGSWQQVELVTHKAWEDFFVRTEKNRLCRGHQKKECATILAENENMLRLKWDNWGEEVFSKNKDGIWQAQ